MVNKTLPHMKKKFSSGEATQYLTRKAALRKLQISLNHFRMLCIFKGIYPREPNNRKKAQRGHSGIKILYHKKDIQLLYNEPLIWVLRSMNVYFKRLDKARSLKDFEKLKKLRSNPPQLKLDHIVKERYPTFIDALNDLDDCLTLLCLFSTFPSMKTIKDEEIKMAKQLTTEFMLAVIEGKSLRKVFISIKGFYFQADIRGQIITWVIPHCFPFREQSKKEVDFKTMSLFAQFYIYLLGFVNCHLYNTLNLEYPPKLIKQKSNQNVKSLVTSKESKFERCASLNVQLKRLARTNVFEKEELVAEIDDFEENRDQLQLVKIKAENDKIEQLKVLFKGCKFFLNREVPQHVLVFIIRCFGGIVSWDENVAIGSTFSESDESITHQVIDRPLIDKQYASRFYVQPQWVFDSINARQLLPENKYYIGVTLPPHLSPFVSENEHRYVPPEESLNEKEKLDLFNIENKEEEIVDCENEVNADSNSDSETESPKVKAGETYREKPNAEAIRKKYETKLREKMIRRKHKVLYKKLTKSRQRKDKEINLLKKKRKMIDEDNKESKKFKTSV